MIVSHLEQASGVRCLAVMVRIPSCSVKTQTSCRTLRIYAEGCRSSSLLCDIQQLPSGSVGHLLLGNCLERKRSFSFSHI
ncbi:uncharacterized [Tachysurus ichikawai]